LRALPPGTRSPPSLSEPAAGSDLKALARPRGSTGITTSSTAPRLHFQRNEGRPADRGGEDDRIAGRDGISLLVVSDGMPGFSRGKKLDKMGLHAQDSRSCSSTTSGSR